MANTLKFKRGLLAGLPTAAEGEPLFTTDTADLYIGTSTGNQRFQKYIASGATTQILRGDGSLYTFPLNISSPSNGQVLKYNGTAWVNDSDAGITGSGSSGQVAYFTGATTQAGNNNLFWDISNSRLGIGTNVPAHRLDINGNIRIPNSNFIYINSSSGTAIGALTIDAGDNIVFNTPTGGDTYIRTSGTTIARFLSTGEINLGGTSATTTPVVKIKSTGDVGIGTQNPLSLLHVQGTATATLARFVTPGNAGILLSRAGIGDPGDVTISVSNLGALNISAANAIRLSVGGTIYGVFGGSTGNLLLQNGGTYNDTGERLQVSGTTKLGGVTTITGSSTTLLNVISTGTAAYIGMGDSSGSFTYIGSDDGSFLVQTPGNSYSTKFLINSSGSVGIGTSTLSVYNLRISKTITGTNPFAVWQDGTVMSTASGTVRGFSNSLRTEAATFTVSNYAHFAAEQFALGAGSSVTTQVGFLVDNTLTGATNNYAFQGSLAAGTGRWNLFMNGGARNFLGGRLLLATTSDLGNIVTNLAITGAATISGINQLGTVQTDVSTLAVGIWNQMNLASGGTFTSYMHYRADAGTLGGSTLTNQYGYFVSGNAIGATNNYGFYGDIAAATGRWNLYMNGTGANYLNGNTGYSTTNPLTKVHIRTGNAASTLEGLRLANGSNDPGAGNRLSFYFSDGASNIAGGFLDVVKNGSDGDMLFFTSVSNGSPTEKVRFFGGGNVGIGTGSTNSGDRLQVSGTLRVTSQSTLLGNVVVGTLSVGTGMYWNNTNNRLGIGHSLPESQLHVRNATGCVFTIESTNAGFVAAPVETSINFYGYGSLLQAQISSQDRQANITGGKLYLRVKDASNVLQDRLVIDRDGSTVLTSTITSTQYRLSALNTAPATASSTGTLGEIRIDADHIYICTATNTWKRVAIATF